jgi:hypothetical protein
LKDIAFTSQGPDPDQVVIAFVTYNDHGNNLYIDNLTLGARPNTVDLSFTSVANIPPGIFVTPGTDSVSINPQLHLTNLGTAGFVPDSLNRFVYLRSYSVPYFDSVEIGPLGAGRDTLIEFTELLINPNTAFDFIAYLSMAQDTIRYNDTLYQYTYFQQGVQRNVLFQEFTSATSLGCAINNVGLNRFIDSNFNSVVAIKYPWGVPSPNDSMYLAAKAQVDSLVAYFNAAFVPLTYADGNTFVNLPYNTDSLLYAPYNYRLSIGSPVDIAVTDSLAGNTMFTRVDINVLAPLENGSFKLKVNALEREINYDTIPTNWYDSTYFDVFRQAIPGIYGIPIGTGTGQQSYTFAYEIQPGWNSSQIFTAAYIENETTREVLNSAKGGNFTPSFTKRAQKFAFEERLAPDPFASFVHDQYRNQIISGPQGDIRGLNTVYKYYVQLFEGYYPPPNWQIINPDALSTFVKYSGVNGPSFSGTTSIQMPFYNYDTVNAFRRDTIKSQIYYGLRDSNIVTFDYAYAPYNNTYRDSLKVLVSVDGGVTFPYQVFSKGGNGLATAPATTVAFAPTNISQWKTDTIRLNGIVSVQPVSGIIPDKFELEQNYPNPFNPVTKIKFAISSKSFVSLKIYDVTGREIRSYLNATVQPGTYSVDFDGTGLSSGVYFYSLSAGDFMLTRKMVLIK